MKTTLILILFAVVVCYGCSKKTSLSGPAKAGAYKGVVIKNACCQVAIQTISGSSIGQSWTDDGSSSSKHYEHAFKVANACRFGNYLAGDTISFNIIAPQVQNCACCMMFTTAPDTAYFIEVLR
jgi:hypothetical protein